MDRKEIHDEIPLIADGIIGGVEIDCVQSLDPMRFAFGLTLEAQKNSAVVGSRENFFSLLTEDKGV